MVLKGIVKSMNDPDDLFHTKKISCKDGIIRFLHQKDSATNPEILKYLVENDAKYTRMGLNKLLASMVQEKILKVDKTRKLNRYSLADKKLDIEYFGMLYSSHASRSILQTTNSSVSSIDEKNVIEDLVRRAGVYAVYNQIIGWILTTFGKTDNEKLEVHDKWLKSVQAMPFLSTHFYSQLKILTGEDEEVGFSSIFSNYDFKLKEIKKLENMLGKLYPVETNALRNVWKSIESIDKNHQKIKKELEERKSFDEYKKRLSLKNKKQSKQNMELNVCPHCHFNGKTKIKTGPLKGRKFSKGFALQYKDEEIEIRYCPQCTYSEKRPVTKIDVNY